MPAQTTQLALFIIRFVCVCDIFFWPASFMLPQALRAAGDARFTMVVSMFSMWLFRVGASIVLGTWLGWGLVGVWAVSYTHLNSLRPFFVPRKGETLREGAGSI